jgi:transposase
METPACSGCRARDARIAELERRLAAAEARLGVNSSNSSLPPSADPLGAPKPVVAKKSKRQRGGQPGHPPHLKQLLPPERVARVFRMIPKRCAQCQATLAREASPDAPPPTRFQVVDLPPIAAVVREYQGHSRTCPCCRHVTSVAVPARLRACSVGPRLSATLSYLTGYHGLSKRAVEDIAETVFAAPVSLGTVANLEQEMSAALATAHQQALEAVRQADVKHADETSWKQAGRLRWLWAAATASVAAFVVHARRGAAGLAALLGAPIGGIVCSDRWPVYACVPAERRQLCWAHLKRDFQNIVDRGGPSVAVGRTGLRVVHQVFHLWHLFRGGSGTRPQLRQQMGPLQNRLQRALLEGAMLGDDAKVATFCENVLALEAALWTFVDSEGVEPTNNHIERLLRRAVLWRKRSFGSQSAAGCRFVERLLTVVQTLRLQQRPVLATCTNPSRPTALAYPAPNWFLPGERLPFL